MARLRCSITTAALVAVSAPALGQETPRSGEWLDPGAYCAFGVRAVVPDGYEAISFGNGVELRAAGGRGPTLAELGSFTRGGGMPAFEEFADLMRLPCKEGFEAQASRELREAPGLDSLGVLIQRCVGPSSSYGVFFARAALTVEGGDHDASVIVLFGDEPFQVGRVSFRAENFFSEADAETLFETMTAGLAACAIEEPPAPPPPPPPTDWLSEGPHCAFGLAFEAPEGVEIRLGPRFSNGQTIDARVLGADETTYFEPFMQVWPRRADLEMDPTPRQRPPLNTCAGGSGFEHSAERETLSTVDGEQLELLTQRCVSPSSGAEYGVIGFAREIDLPDDPRWLHGYIYYAEGDLPRNIRTDEWLSYGSVFPPAEARAVATEFAASIRLCEE